MATNYVTCRNCNTQNTALNPNCMRCGAMMPPVAPMPMQPAPQYGMQAKPQGAEKKIAAGVCGIVLGGLGVHKFILGYTNEGVIMLVTYILGAIFLCGIPSIVVAVIGIIEGIMYLTKSDEEFVQTYVYGKKTWF
jgi:TM2 domain-containing membrane protein YozV